MIRIALSLLALSILAGCGIKGGLERPGPMWGDRALGAPEDEQTATEREQTGPADVERRSGSDQLGSPR
jgi:predicted small lipoprotein YifL